MSVAPELLTFSVGVDTSSAEAGLASLGDSADGAAAGLEEKLAGASAGLKNLGKGSTSAARGLAGVGGAVAIFNPKLGAMIRNAGTLTRSLSILRVGALGPLAGVLAVVGGAYLLYNRRVEETAKAEKEATERADALALGLDAVTASAASVEEQVRLATGQIDSFGIAAETQAVEAQAASDGYVAAYDAQIEASNERIEALRQEVRQGKNMSDELREERLELMSLTRAREDEIDRAQRQIDTVGLLVEFREESRLAVEAEAEAERKAAEERRKRDKANRERKQALEELDRIDTDARRSAMTDEEALVSVYDEKIARVRELGQLLGKDTTSTVAALELAARQELIELREKEFEREKERQAQLLAEKERHEAEQTAIIKEEERERFENRMALESEILSFVGSMADVAALSAKKRADGDEQAAKRSLAVAKTLGLAQIAIDTASGIQKALATFIANPVLATAGIAALVAGAAVQAAAVSSQTLHQGGRLAPDEEMIRTVILSDEKITGDAQVISPEGSRRMERGESGGANTVAIPIYQHFGEFFADVVEGGGTPLHDMINKGRTVGRRTA